VCSSDLDVGILNSNLRLRLNEPYFRIDVVMLPTGLTHAFDGRTDSVPIAETLSPDYHDGVYQQWSAGVEHEFPRSIVAGVTYVGSRGSSLPLSFDPNQGVPSGPPVRNLAFGPAESVASVGTSRYDSLQTRLERRLTKGGSILASYTWSRSEDLGSAVFGSHSSNGFPQNSRNFEGERGPSDFDTPHRIAISSVWDVPTGPLGLWQVAAIVTYQSGRPFTVFYGPSANYSGTTNGANGGSGLDRPNQIGDPVVASPSPTRWFDPSAFAPPHFAFGTVGRNTLRGDSFGAVDLAVSRRFALGDSTALQARVEVFNLLNTDNFLLPVGDLTSAAAGTVARAFDARQLQLAIKLLF